MSLREKRLSADQLDHVTGGSGDGTALGSRPRRWCPNCNKETECAAYDAYDAATGEVLVRLKTDICGECQNPYVSIHKK